MNEPLVALDTLMREFNELAIVKVRASDGRNVAMKQSAEKKFLASLP